MSTLSSRVGDARAHSAAVRRAVVRVVFGDRRGLALFLGGLCFFALYWRIGVFITDTNAIVNALVNVADGRLQMVEAPFGAGHEAPGTYVHDGRYYGRNYGIVVLAVPVLWALEAVGSVLDPRIVLVGAWSLLLVVFFGTLARILDRRAVAVGGSVLAVGAFAGNVALATPLSPDLFPVLALQIVTMVAAALTGVVVYRLVAGLYTIRVGLFAGAVTVLATPVAFWASLPKRHAFTALLLVAAAYGLSRSRGGGDATHRALAYACVGLTAWIHAAEALVLFLPLVVVDLATASANDRRTLGVVALTFLLSLIPFLATNAAISGNPLKPPRMLESYNQAPAELDLSSGGGGGDSSGGDSSGGSSFSLPTIPVVSRAILIASVFGELLWEGVDAAVSSPDRVVETFFRSGYIPGVARRDGLEAINLTVLESAPLLGGLAALPIASGVWLRSRGLPAVRAYLRTPAGATDAFFGIYAALLVALYLDKLPLHAQVTVRYLHPLFPIGVYALVRLAPVRRTLDRHWRVTVWTYAGSVLVGGQLVVALLAIRDVGRGEAVQFHALLSLATAALLAAWLLAASVSEAVPDRIGGVPLGLAAGAGTVFVLLSGWEYFDYAGAFALPIVRALTDLAALV